MSKSLTNDECWERFQFRLSTSKPHPIHKETMYFDGLEAEYLGRIERELEFFKEAYERLRQKLDWMTTQEMYRLRDALKEKPNDPRG